MLVTKVYEKWEINVHLRAHILHATLHKSIPKLGRPSQKSLVTPQTGRFHHIYLILTEEMLTGKGIKCISLVCRNAKFQDVPCQSGCCIVTIVRGAISLSSFCSQAACWRKHCICSSFTAQTVKITFVCSHGANVQSLQGLHGWPWTSDEGRTSTSTYNSESQILLMKTAQTQCSGPERGQEGRISNTSSTRKPRPRSSKCYT